MKLRASLVSAVFVLSFAVSATQAQLYWDIDGATAGAGGVTPAGTWDAATSNWNLDPQGDGDSGGGTTWTAGGDAIFSAGTDASGAFTVTLSGTQTAGSILFQEGTVTLSGDQLNLASTGSPADYNGDGNVDAADYVAWRKLPTLFGGDPAGYTAWRTDFGASGGGGGGTITTATGTTSTINSVIGGAAALTKAGADRLVLGGANVYSGGTNINAGTLQFANTNAMPLSGAITVLSGATLAVNAGGAGEWTNATSGVGSIGGLIAGTGRATNQITWANGSNLGIDTTNAAGGTLAYSGVIGSFRAAAGTTNAVGLSKRGPGTLVLDGANTYTGPTTMANTAAGTPNTLKLTAANTLNPNTTIVMPASNGNAIVELFAGTSPPGTSDKFNQTVAGISGGGSGATSPTIIDVGYATLTIDVPSGQSHVYNGYLRTNFTDPATRGKVIKTGAGDLTLGGLNNSVTLGMAGEFSMEGGRLFYGNNVGTGGNNASAPSQMTLKGGTIVKALADPATSLSVTPRTLEIAGSFSFDHNSSTANSQFLPSAPGGGLGGINLTVNNPTITVNNGVIQPNSTTALPFIPTFILSGIITDGANSYGFTKDGPGIMTLDRVNNYQGTTTIAEGAIRLTAAVGASGFHSTIGDGNSPVVLSGGSIDYTGAPLVAGGPRVLTINNPVTMTASSGIGHTTGSGAGGLTTTPVGNTTVDTLFSNFTATAGTLTIYNNGSSNEPNFANPYANPLEFRAGFTGTGFNFTQPVVVQNHTNVNVPNRTASLMSSNTSGSHTFSGVISGNGGYVRNGDGGTSVLTGNNTYTGNTTIDAGTLSITNPFLADTADVLFATIGIGNPIFNLDFIGTDTIDQLFIDGIAQATGTWGAIGSGAANESALITDTGLLLVTAAGGSSPGAVPEPGTLALAMMSMVVLFGVRRRHG